MYSAVVSEDLEPGGETRLWFEYEGQLFYTLKWNAFDSYQSIPNEAYKRHKTKKANIKYTTIPSHYLVT